MIRIELSERGDGADMATCGDLTVAHAKASALRMLARKLVAAGSDDEPWQAWRGPMLCLRGSSLHSLAVLDVRDGDKGITTSEWHPHPTETSADAVAADRALNMARAVFAETRRKRFCKISVGEGRQDRKAAGVAQERAQ